MTKAGRVLIHRRHHAPWRTLSNETACSRSAAMTNLMSSLISFTVTKSTEISGLHDLGGVHGVINHCPDAVA